MIRKLDKLWVRFLWRVDAWMCARLQAAFRREKVRWLKRELKRQDGWRN